MEATTSDLGKLNCWIQKGLSRHSCWCWEFSSAQCWWTLNEMFSVTSNIEEHRVYKAQTGRGFFQILRKKLSLHDPGTQLSPMWWLPTEIKAYIGLTLSSFSLMDFTSLLSSKISCCCIKQATSSLWITSFAVVDDFTNIKMTAQVPSKRGQARENKLSLYLLTRSPIL